MLSPRVLRILVHRVIFQFGGWLSTKLSRVFSITPIHLWLIVTHGYNAHQESSARNFFGDTSTLHPLGRRVATKYPSQEFMIQPKFQLTISTKISVQGWRSRPRNAVAIQRDWATQQSERRVLNVALLTERFRCINALIIDSNLT